MRHQEFCISAFVLGAAIALSPFSEYMPEDVPIVVELRRADVAGMNVTRPS